MSNGVSAFRKVKQSQRLQGYLLEHEVCAGAQMTGTESALSDIFAAGSWLPLAAQHAVTGHFDFAFPYTRKATLGRRLRWQWARTPHLRQTWAGLQTLNFSSGMIPGESSKT